jgi:glycosyltransferase involved in cell wall biosynthesis
MLTEVPAVSFDNDGAPEVVVPGETGILVPFGDIHSLADGVLKLAGEPDLRREFGRRARQRCLGMFDWRRMVAELDRLYRSLGDDPSGP